MSTNKYAEFTKLVEAMEADFEKFYDKEVNAAGTRVRKHLQELAKLCKEGRNDVTAVKNARTEAKGAGK
jgi:DNA-binding sugar fermentation-stimulating protein